MPHWILALIATLTLAAPALAAARWPGRPEALPVTAALIALAVWPLALLLVGPTVSDTGVQDNYYIAPSRLSYVWPLPAMLAGLALLLWVQGRWLGHPLPRALPVLFWVFLPALLVTVLAPLALIDLFSAPMAAPRLTETQFARISRIMGIATTAGFLAVSAYLVLFIWALFARFIDRLT